MYATLGTYDSVLILEAPEEKAIFKFVAMVSAEGEVNTETWRAIPFEDFSKIIQELPELSFVIMNIDVVCLGHCAWDLLFVVDEFPQPDSKLEALESFQQGGGPAATAAVTLSRLGARVAIIGKVGDDIWGQGIVDGLAEEGVATRGLIVEHGKSSPLSLVIMEGTSGKRSIVHNRGTVDPLSPEDLNTELLFSGKILLIDSLHPEAGLAGVKMARDKGIQVVLDTGAFKPDATELLKFVDVVIAPEYFVSDYAPDKSSADVCKDLLASGPEVVVITQGERGGVCFTPKEKFSYPGFEVDVADTTGAGDVFHGAFVFGVLQEWDLKKTVTFASGVAALKCTKLGGRTGIPSLQETLDFLRERSMWS
ncbi:MAG: GYD domain-containing protein [Gemmatimonadota bacterium]|nr:MAG: GYD domain-containing protein [Gemmatimonadota bacterium]